MSSQSVLVIGGSGAQGVPIVQGGYWRHFVLVNPFKELFNRMTSRAITTTTILNYSRVDSGFNL